MASMNATDAVITRTRIAALAAAVLGSALVIGCTSAPSDPTLRPPGGPTRIAGETVIRNLDGFDFVTGYPKRFLEQRVAFNAACDMSRRSPDRQAARDAALLFELASEAGSPEQFAASLQGRFELVQVEAAVEPGGAAGGRTGGGSVGGAAADAKVDSKTAPVAEPASAARGMMTGYATPEVTVRLREDERFRFPIFGDLRTEHPELAKLPRRELIASEAARKAAIAWIDDPLAWALVETNGSARLVIDESTAKDGRKRNLAISRVATNDRPWTSIGRWLANRGLLDGATYTFADVARSCAANPAKAVEAALDNERVVFFATVDDAAFPPPYGLRGGKLMSAYSCAADQSIYPAGTVLVIVEREAKAEGAGRDAGGDAAAVDAPTDAEPARRSARFLFVHDAGGAIVGPGRVDVYFGEGTDALLRAGQTRSPVEVYRLRARD